jgi:hypothetical protein
MTQSVTILIFWGVGLGGGGLRTRVNEALGLVHTFRFSTGRLVPIIAGQSSGTQESIGLFTQPGRLADRKFTGRLQGSTRNYPILFPVVGR